MKGGVQVAEPGCSPASRPVRFHMILDEILFNLFGSHPYVTHTDKCACGVKHGWRIRPSELYQWSRSPKKTALHLCNSRQRRNKSKAFELANQAGLQAQFLVAVAGMRACLERAELVIHHRLPPSWSDYS
ncbi:unnamed protein product [Clonostachys solani]|uniref:Uncharacterized protein n=1 Tax=Clonostachys solani TaxID=160281 RepID=A0A9N9YVY9_9HYPO|nr:unnamed protein product [Clonostachys solani]